MRVYCGRRSKTVGAGRSSFPIGFGRIIMSTASDPQLPQRPWRSRSVGTRQSTHHQWRSTHACPRSTFVFDMGPLWGKTSGKVDRSQVTFFEAKLRYESTKTAWTSASMFEGTDGLAQNALKANWRLTQFKAQFRT